MSDKKETISLIVPANIADIAIITSILNNAFKFSRKSEADIE